MRYAVLSDVHSNLEALSEALAYIEKEKIDHLLFLGDLIGYGANPNECLDLVCQCKGKVVAGNHDKAIADDELLSYFSSHAHEALLWTRGELNSKWNDFLRDLPLLHIGKDMTLAHGSINSPESFQYLFYFDDAVPSFERMQTPIGWIGHTHVPQIFLKKKRSTSYLPEGDHRLDKNEVYLINPGSIGQPRDQDPRLSFAIFDDDAYNLKIIRLPYDNHKAAEKIRKAGLPKFLADRLL